MKTSLEAEAEIFARYLVGQAPPQRVIDLYGRALAVAQPITATDQKWLKRVNRNPGLLGWVDAGLAWAQPTSEVRRRLYVMFSILEASPTYADKFLPRAGGWSQLPQIVWSGLKAVIKGAIGTLMVRLL